MTKRSLVVGSLCILLALLAFNLWKEVFARTYFQVTFFDVGQGDAIFLRTMQGHQMLIDGGPDDTVLEKLAQHMPVGDRTLDLVILTHPDEDHMAGLLAVLARYQVATILWTGVTKETKIFQNWKEAVAREQEQGAIVVFARAGQRVLWSRAADSFVRILYPFEKISGTHGKEQTNETSVVSQLHFQEHRVLLPGDISKDVELKLVESAHDLSSGILKVAHHGSKSSSSAQFLEAVHPAIAVISVGRQNRYKHPHPNVLATLAGYGIDILRTDHKGDITFQLH